MPRRLQTPESGSVTLALTDPDGTLRAVLTAEQLARLARRGCPDHPAGDCDCPLIDRPPETDASEPTAAQRVRVKTRDRTCRFPNCGQRVGWADLDHVIAHARGGARTCTSLCCLCGSHHRLKTRRSDWHFAMTRRRRAVSDHTLRNRENHPTTRPSTTLGATARRGSTSHAGAARRRPAALSDPSVQAGAHVRLAAMSTSRHVPVPACRSATPSES